MKLALYRLLTNVGAPLIDAYLSRRLRKGKEHPARYPERRGMASIARPEGPLVWMHGASVGESLAILPLVERLKQTRPGHTILVTTGSVTSAELLSTRLPDGAIHQFVPVDRVAFVHKFLDHWKPDIALWAESEFWPNLLLETSGRGIPMVLINGRISDKSFATWQKHPGVIRRLLDCFDLCLGQSEVDRDRLVTLGKADAGWCGNLKYAVPPLPVDEADLATLRTAIGQRPVWLAASTHSGEEEIIARVHKRLREDIPDLLTLLVPRHPHRGEDIRDLVHAQGLSVARRAAGDGLGAGTDIYLADTMGEMGLFFRLAPIVFMGKSLVENGGGQNPIEPARLGCALLFGPHMGSFVEATDLLKQAGACIVVADEEALHAALQELLHNPGKVASLRKAADVMTGTQADVLDRTMDALDPFLQRINP